jgi:hypothetical protein
MLILKKEIKDIFKSLGMPEGLTVTRGAGRGANFISISGQCGAPILTITKVEVGTKLTKTEREILIDDYIVPAIKNNKKNILKYIEKLKDTKVDDRIAELKSNYKLSVDTGFRDSIIRSVSIQCNNISVTLDPEGNLGAGNFTINLMSTPIDTYGDECKKAISTAKKVLPEYLALLEVRKAQGDVIKELRVLLTEKCGF